MSMKLSDWVRMVLIVESRFQGLDYDDFQLPGGARAPRGPIAHRVSDDPPPAAGRYLFWCSRGEAAAQWEASYWDTSRRWLDDALWLPLPCDPDE